MNTIQVYDGNPDDPTTKWLQFKNPIIDEVEYTTLVPQTVKNNVTIIYNSTANRNGINWEASDIYIFFVFNLNKTGTCPYAGSQFLNNTVLSPFRVTSPFDYNYDSDNVTQPQLRDAVLNVAIWGTGTGPITPTPVNIPVVDFIGSPTSGSAPLTVVFTDGSTNTPTSWSWNFGDGNTATTKNPSHTYTVPGTYSVTLTATNAAGSGTLTRPNYITVTSAAAPTVTGISPNTGPTAGGTSVIITGTNFLGTTAVQFGGINAASYTVNSATQITATSPAHAAGTIDVTVTTPVGTSATSAADQFTYTAAAAPTVTGISPNTGPTAGGTSVIITGTNFLGTTAVQFGGINAASYTVNSATQITATSPAHAAGTIDVTVTTPVGTSATSAADQFTYTAATAPTVSSITPATGVNTAQSR